MRRAFIIFATLVLVISASVRVRTFIHRRAAASQRQRFGTGILAANGKAASSAAQAFVEGDQDGDGIADERELALAKAYFPYLSLDAHDHCARHGVLFRLAPHPEDPTKIAIWYAVLYENDCGLRGIGSHVGDDEVFGEVIDPTVPAPAGILAVRAISHQNTTCERVTSCGSLEGCEPCAVADRGGRQYPVVFASSSKHGNYTSKLACDVWPCDLAGCSINPAPDMPEFVNAGEPGKPLCTDLTAHGFVTKANGWTEPSLLGFDPWSNQKFGRAGNVTDDLTDPSFLISTSGC